MFSSVKTTAVTHANPTIGRGHALDDDGNVVGMSEIAIRTAGDLGQSGNDDDQGVPSPAEREDAPPAQRLRGDNESQHDQ